MVKIGKTSAWGLLLALFAAIIPISIVLLPKFILWCIFIFLVIAIYFVYSKFIVPIMKWQYKWWSFQSRKLKLNREEVLEKIGEPEVSIMAFLLDEKYDWYFKIQSKEGFIIKGTKFRRGFLRNSNIKVKYDNEGLKITLFRLSREAPEEIKRLETYLREE